MNRTLQRPKRCICEFCGAHTRAPRTAQVQTIAGLFLVVVCPKCARQIERKRGAR